MSLFQITYILLWVVVLLLVPLCIVLLQIFSEWRQAPERAPRVRQPQLAVGSKFPEFSTQDLRNGKHRRSTDLVSREPTIFLVLQTTCGSCQGILKQIRGHSGSTLSGLNTVVLCVGSSAACRAALDGPHELPMLSVDVTTLEGTGIGGLPAVYVVDQDGGLIHVQQNVRSVADLFPELEALVGGARQIPVQVA